MRSRQVNGNAEIGTTIKDYAESDSSIYMRMERWSSMFMITDRG
ncbi:MAG TPA: hypothetical protein VJS37_05405 [Terriglobales bacterium]|nr:hypothetical protein [Terriglobales bacterium]